MFRMIGGDGREYGPVTADQVRQWIADQRANGQTMVQPEGEAGWQPLSSLPEFAEALAAAWASQPETPPPPPPLMAPGVDTAGPFVGPVPSESWSAGESEINISHCLGRGWALISQHFFLVAGACSLVWVITTLTAMATCIGSLVSLVIAGPLYAGMMLVLLRLIRGQAASVGEVFGCFGPPMVPLMLVWIVTGLASGLGMALCLVPGLFLKVMWAFSLVLAADRQLDFGSALGVSWRTVGRRFFRIAGLMLVAWLPVIIFEFFTMYRITGYLMDTLGPVGSWDMTRLEPQLKELALYASKLEIERQLVLLLNLPFATAALLYAYEDLFGTHRLEARG
ncbi:MAG: DUF4339 domain-containing protein [Limisphaerales bacterium]